MMIKYALSPLFFKLYAAIVSVILIAILAASSVWQFQDESTAISDFVEDTQMIATTVIKTLEQEPENFPVVAKTLKQHLYQSTVLLTPEELKDYLTSSEHIHHQQDIDIYYDHHNEGLHAVYQLKKHSQLLVISDMPIESYEENQPADPAINFHLRDEIKSNEFNTIAITVLICCFIIIALVLLFSTANISRHIHSLIKASQKIAKGNLQERMDTQVPAPLKDLAVSFNKMSKDLSDLLDEKQVLNNAIAHELRTPLTKLHLAISFAQGKNTDPNIAEFLNSIEHYTDELEGLTNSILTLAKLSHENQPLKLERLDLARLVNERALELSALDNSKQLSVLPQEPVFIEADILFLQLAIDNLLKNALIHAKQKVTISVENQADSITSLSITDDGSGIPDSQAEQLFTPFYRADQSRNKNDGGYGLGLAIVKSVVDRHDGSISISRSPSTGGACFTLNLRKTLKKA